VCNFIIVIVILSEITTHIYTRFRVNNTTPI
jgi:multisubunit Na+/H+ antiporter MnhF subunit